MLIYNLHKLLIRIKYLLVKVFQHLVSYIYWDITVR